MEFVQDAFPAGENVNGIRNKEKIKILICYLIKTIKQPLTKDFLLTTLYGNFIANYFEISQALYELEQADAIKMIEHGKLGAYVLTDNGRKVADDMHSELSNFIKHKSVSATLKALISEKRDRENSVEITKMAEDKYKVHICLYSMADKKESDDKLLEVTVYVADEMQAEVLKRSFFNNPKNLYENVISALTDNIEFKE